MFELPESMLVRTELFAAWGVILLLAGIMMFERLRGFSRELFGSRGTVVSQSAKAQRPKRSGVRWGWPALMLVVPTGLAIEFVVEHIIAMTQR